MLIAHLEHAEVYVPLIEKTFFRSVVGGKKKLEKRAKNFVDACADTDERAGIAMMTSPRRGLGTLSIRLEMSARRGLGTLSIRLERAVVLRQNV